MMLLKEAQMNLSIHPLYNCKIYLWQLLKGIPVDQEEIQEGNSEYGFEEISWLKDLPKTRERVTARRCKGSEDV